MSPLIIPFATLLALLLPPLAGLGADAQISANAAPVDKKLPLPGVVFLVGGNSAFIIPAKGDPAGTSKPWVWYAPTLPGLPGQEEHWMFEQFLNAGIAIAGIDVGESYGSPAGNDLFTHFHSAMTGSRGFAAKPVLLGRSRGGLMALSWAASHPDKVAAFAGIYPVCSLASYPGIATAAGAYRMKPEELQTHLPAYNPIDRLAALAKASVPFFAIHGDADRVVPLEANSGLMKERYTALGGDMQLIVPAGQGHNMWSGFFQSQELLSFVTTHALAQPTTASPVNDKGSRAAPSENGAARELIRDPHFRAGFHLIDPQPGRRLAYGRLAGVTADTEPVWDLDQWSSRFPLAEERSGAAQKSLQRWTNPGKTVTRGEPGSPQSDLSLAVYAVAEYDKRARKANEPWVHLLLEQSFVDPPALANLASARFQIQARLLRSQVHRTDDYSPGLHAAQFQVFLMLQNRNRASPDYGRLLWFGIPLYDDRSPFPKEHKQQDTGGTEMFIFTPGGEVFSDRSAHERQWISVDKELRPLLLEALETARQRGFLRESRDLADYRLTGLNLGWEVPGLFDVEMQVRDLSLRVQSTSVDK